MSTSALIRPEPRHRAADLVTAYLPGSFYYSSPRGTLLADGVHATVHRRPDESHAEAAAAAMARAADAGVRDPMVVGALGFRPEECARLVVPALVRQAEAPDGDAVASALRAGSETAGLPTTWTMRRESSPQEYTAGVRSALDLIAEGELRKVVLARGLEMTAGEPVAVPALLARLVGAEPTVHVFAADITDRGDPATRTLIGASPELLVSRHGTRVLAVPLAGSAPRTGEPDEDLRRVAALRSSDKDRREHAMVTDRVAEILGRFCRDVDVPAEPEVLGTATMWHLASRISGELTDPSMSSLALAEALHPTPAVCGVPAERARRAILDIESADRGYYSGMVGWCAADGDGEWVVTIRSAEVCADTVRLFAGAGVVAGSDPESELAETGAKFRTLLRAVGLDAEA
ncbi:MAG: isochorismate synthase [Pseudonocardia sp.]|nr:isochorismate synthase [Pseudonocardia sp.]